MSDAEYLVRRKDELEREANIIEDWRRNLRLGRNLRIAYQPRAFLALMGYGDIVHPIPGVVQTEFYAFLNARLGERHTSIREIERALASATIPNDEEVPHG